MNNSSILISISKQILHHDILRKAFLGAESQQIVKNQMHKKTFANYLLASEDFFNLDIKA